MDNGDNLISLQVDTPKMVFCQKCSQIMAPSVDNGRMVYVCDSEQHKGHPEIEQSAPDNICVYKRYIAKGAEETASASFSGDRIKDPTLQRQPFRCDACFSHDGDGDREAVLFLANNDDQKLTVMLVCLTCRAVTEQKKEAQNEAQ